jgi:hypothetical protein
MLKRLEQWAMVSYLSAVIALSQGATVDLPEPGDARARFDAWLVSPLKSDLPEAVDPERAEIEAALHLN